ncbi:pimeloyl-ACP methyl ester carboxylesterase [Arthrobacter sp. V1I9]|nr:hypothetical protein [Arthrobacter sp. V1I9]MDQ0870859.1 pimeloyl-ACP methyl ester carboxylesterase [Arthrobacter sp. V1I9]
MPWLDVLGNDIHYTDSGRGRPVVLLHGHASASAAGNQSPLSWSRTSGY